MEIEEKAQEVIAKSFHDSLEIFKEAVDYEINGPLKVADLEENQD